MPTLFQAAVVTCAAQVVPTNPTTVPLGFVGGLVRVIRIVIPDGHAGLTGIAIGFGGNRVLPLNTGAYYSGDGREVIFDYVDNNAGVTWQAFVCNQDTISHVWEVDFDLDTLAAQNQSSSIVPLTASDILAVGTSNAIGS